MTSNPNQKIEITKTDARQGSNRPKVIYVLVAALVLVLIVFAAVSLTVHP